MKKYTYYFMDGTRNTIEVSDEWYELLTAMDEEERKKTYNYERHNYPLSAVDFEGDTFTDPRGDAFDALMRQAGKEKFDAAIDTLTEKQQELIHKRYNEMLSVGEIAEQEGVCISAISHRLERIQKKLEKLLA